MGVPAVPFTLFSKIYRQAEFLLPSVTKSLYQRKIDFKRRMITQVDDRVQKVY